jgi:hypothetical protein
MQYPSGNTYEGEWLHDCKHGYGTMIWKDLDEIYTGHWYDNHPHGYGEHIWGDSNVKTVRRQHCNIYRGEFEHGQKHGKGSYFYANGSQYTGYWEHDRKHGIGIYIHVDNCITVGHYEDNKLISGQDTQGSLAVRDTGDITPQFYLNIMDILSTYPTFPVGEVDDKVVLKQRKQYIKELERLLLKYNQYLKNAYKHYVELSNRQRQRSLLILPARHHYHYTSPAQNKNSGTTQHNHYPAQNDNCSSTPRAQTNNNPPAHSSNSTTSAVGSTSHHQYDVMIAATRARDISKRLFCMSLDQCIHFLRDIDLIDDIYITTFDVYTILSKMKAHRRVVMLQLYKSFIAQSLSMEHEIIVDHDTLTDFITAANLSIGEVVDSYMDPLGQDVDLPRQDSQPILEHEFVELLVRVVAEGYSRRGYVSVDWYQILSKILHTKVSNEVVGWGMSVINASIELVTSSTYNLRVNFPSDPEL